VVLNLESLPDVLRVEEVAAVLRISRSRAYEEAAVFRRTNGATGLPAIRIGRSLRVPKSALQQWIDTQLEVLDPD
jgi:predicted DNA-binding transcriptional regulator AlpA